MHFSRILIKTYIQKLVTVCRSLCELNMLTKSKREKYNYIQLKEEL